MIENNQTITQILITMVEQNEEVTKKISEIARIVEESNMTDLPDMENVGAQYYDKEFEVIQTNFYWKLEYLASDDTGLEVLKQVLKIRPNNVRKLAKVFIKAVGDTFAKGLELPYNVEEEKSSYDGEETTTK